MEEKLIQLFTDCSEQSGETYEQRSINDSDFDELAKDVIKLFTRHKTQLANGIQTSENSLNISDIRKALFNEVREKWVGCKDVADFDTYIRISCNVF